MLGLGLLLGLVEQLAAELFGVAAALFEDAADLALAAASLRWYSARICLACWLAASAWAIWSAMPRSRLSSPGNRLPGELPENRQQAEKDHGGPEGQIEFPGRRGQGFMSPAPGRSARRPATARRQRQADRRINRQDDHALQHGAVAFKWDCDGYSLMMHTIKANRVTPSSMAAVMIMAVWMLPATSGWRAMLSTAQEPILPMP